MTDESIVYFKTACRGRKKLRPGEPPTVKPAIERIPRISRLMALAIHFDGLIRKGIVRDYADLARLGGITRARITQIMNLLNLLPEIQEELLFFPSAVHGRDALTERKSKGPRWKSNVDRSGI